MSNNILIVEDDEAIRSSMEDVLELEGYSFHSTRNGQEALDYLNTSSTLPDLILLDLMMPVMNGFVFCENTSKNEVFSKIPVIVMSADGHVNSKKKQTNALAYVKKPFDIDDVLVTIEKALSNSSKS